MDKIEYYPDYVIRDWMDKFQMTDTAYIPECPFSFRDVLQEWINRKHDLNGYTIKDLLNDIDEQEPL